MKRLSGVPHPANVGSLLWRVDERIEHLLHSLHSFRWLTVIVVFASLKLLENLLPQWLVLTLALLAVAVAMQPSLLPGDEPSNHA